MKSILKKIRNRLFQPILDEINEMRNSINEIPHLLINSSSSNYGYSKSKIKVLFLAQSSEFWYALETVYLKMLNDKNFIPILFIIPSRYSEGGEFENKSLAYFQTKQYPNILYFENEESIPGNIIEMLNPDVIFRQAPWEHLVPLIFRTEQLKQYRLCYVPYAIHTLNTEEVFYNQKLHNYAWRLYSDSLHLHDCYGIYNLVKNYNSVVIGNTKFEYIYSQLNSTEHLPWPISTNNRISKLKILWCPHHSLETWLGFATFHKNYMDILEFAVAHPEYDIVFRPHPAMKTALITNNKMTLSEYDKFFSKFAQLPNCYIDSGAEYIHLFHHSDILVSDGIAFLFEYLLTNKPIIRIDSQHSVGFNSYYAKFQQAWYVVNDVDAVSNVISDILSGLDSLKNERNSFSQELYNASMKLLPSDRIIADLKESLLGTN